MADSDDTRGGSGAGPKRPSARPRPPVIDLTATEVPQPEDAARPAAAEPERPAEPAAEAAPSPETPDRAPEAAAAPAGEPAAEAAPAEPHAEAWADELADVSHAADAAGETGPSDEPEPAAAPLPPRDRKALLRRRAAIAGFTIGGIALGALVVLALIGTGLIGGRIPPELMARMSAVETAVGSMQGTVDALPKDPTAAIAGRVETIEGRIDPIARTGEATRAGLASVEAELKETREALNRLQVQAAASGNDATAEAALADRLARIEGQLESLRQAAADARSASEQASNAARGIADDQRLAAANLESASKRLTVIEDRLAASGDAAAASLLAATGALKARIKEGGAFGAERAAVEALAPGKLPQPLAARDATGLVRPAELAARARQALAERPAQGGEAGSAEPGFLERLAANAGGLVTVTREGGGGTSAGPVIARLDAGDAAGAIAEAEKLDAETRAALGPVLAEAELAAETDAALAALERQALDGLAAAGR